jgi:hypothetical protein
MTKGVSGGSALDTCRASASVGATVFHNVCTLQQLMHAKNSNSHQDHGVQGVVPWQPPIATDGQECGGSTPDTCSLYTSWCISFPLHMHTSATCACQKFQQSSRLLHLHTKSNTWHIGRQTVTGSYRTELPLNAEWIFCNYYLILFMIGRYQSFSSLFMLYITEKCTNLSHSNTNTV